LAGAKYWDRGVEGGLDLETILARCEVVTVGIDGGGLDDLLGVAVIGRERETRRWLGWACAFVSPEGMDGRKAERMQCSLRKLNESRFIWASSQLVRAIVEFRFRCEKRLGGAACARHLFAILLPHRHQQQRQFRGDVRLVAFFVRYVLFRLLSSRRFSSISFLHCDNAACGDDCRSG
jgi:hypothetical protein